MRNPLPPQQRLLELFSHEPEDGFIVRRSSGQRLYHSAHIDGVEYYVHRVIWKMHHNEEPPCVDHIVGHHGNRLSNLRAATHSQNQMNKTILPNNRLGVKGVHLRRDGRFRAKITVDGRTIYLGDFRRIEDAFLARLAAENKYHGEFATG